MKLVHRFVLPSLLVLTAFSLSTSLYAQETRTAASPTTDSHEEKDKEKDKDAKKETPIPPEKPVATHHEMNLGGKTLKYTATAGNLLIRDEEDKPYGSIFYVAYTLDGAEAGSRPVSF